MNKEGTAEYAENAEKKLRCALRVRCGFIFVEEL
jgi:hypothetical protein